MEFRDPRVETLGTAHLAAFLAAFGHPAQHECRNFLHLLELQRAEDDDFVQTIQKLGTVPDVNRGDRTRGKTQGPDKKTKNYLEKGEGINTPPDISGWGHMD